MSREEIDRRKKSKFSYSCWEQKRENLQMIQSKIFLEQTIAGPASNKARPKCRMWVSPLSLSCLCSGGGWPCFMYQWPSSELYWTSTAWSFPNSLSTPPYHPNTRNSHNDTFLLGYSRKSLKLQACFLGWDNTDTSPMSVIPTSVRNGVLVLESSGHEHSHGKW